MVAAIQQIESQAFMKLRTVIGRAVRITSFSGNSGSSYVSPLSLPICTLYIHILYIYQKFVKIVVQSMMASPRSWTWLATVTALLKTHTIKWQIIHVSTDGCCWFRSSVAIPRCQMYSNLLAGFG